MWRTLNKSGKNQLGFSLPELMIAASIMGGLALGFTKLTQNGVEGGKRVEAGGQVEETKREILGVLSDRDACLKTFALYSNFSDVVGGGTKTIPNVRDKNNTIRFSANQVFPGVVKLSSIEVKDYNAAKSTAGLLLTFNYKLNSNVNMTKVKRFDLQLELDATNTLLGCVAMAGVQTIDPKQLCDTVIGFDPAGESYFQNSECLFAKASCEKSGGVWELPGETCALGADQKFKVRKEACETERGYLMKVVQGWSFSIEGLATSSMCTVADIKNASKCICRTHFMAKTWSNPPAPTEPDSTGYQAKRIILKGGHFNIVSPIFTLSNPFPDGDNRPRFVKMTGTIHVDNVSPDGRLKWLTLGIGCYRPNRVAYRAQQDWFPSISSSDWTSVHNVGGYKFQTDDFRPTLANGTQVGNTSPASLAPISRGNYIMYSGGGIYVPGDRCALMLYTHDGGAEVLIGGVNTSSEHSTIDTEYGYGPSSWPITNGF